MAETLTNMKRSDQDARDTLAVHEEKEEFPHGLTLNLDNETLTKLGMVLLPKVGTEMMLMAKVEVTGVSQNEQRDGGGEVQKHVTLQITDMNLKAPSRIETERGVIADKLFDHRRKDTR